VLIAIAVLSALLLAVWVILVLVDFRLRPVRYELPADYHGWVVVRYERPECPPLQHDGLVIVVKIGDDGTACTSSSRPTGAGFVNYAYRTPEGDRIELRPAEAEETGMIWARAYETTSKTTSFFVGSQEELSRSSRRPL
jgi:hypothetical protein